MTAEPSTTAADAALGRARAAAAADRHDEAIAWYRRAIALRPPWRTELAGEVALQHLWADRPDSALVWFDVRIAAHPDDLDARIERARALSWLDRHDEAIAAWRRLLPAAGDRRLDLMRRIAQVTAWQDRLDEALALYDSVLALAPGDAEALAGRARVVNWMGRHRQAVRELERLARRGRLDADARADLANAWRWMDRPDRAMRVIGARRDGALGDIARQLRAGRAPGVRWDYRRDDDSDDIVRRTHAARIDVHPDWLTDVHVRLADGRIERPGRPDVRRRTARLVVHRRLGDALAVTADAGRQWNDFDRAAVPAGIPAGDGFALTVIDAWATLTPRDWVRVDASLSRGSLDNPEPVYRGIVYTEASLGVDWRLAHRWMVVASAGRTDYSDGNRRTAGAARIVWTPRLHVPGPWHDRWRLDTGVSALDFRLTPDHGYYSPDDVRSVFQRAAVEAAISRRVSVAASGRLGLEREHGGDWFSTGAWEATLALELGGGLRAEAAAFASRSRLDNRTGYAASGWRVALAWRAGGH